MNKEDLVELKKAETDLGIEELEDFNINLDVDIKYEVWLVNWIKKDVDADYQYLVDYFYDETEAKKCMEFFSELDNLRLIKNQDSNFIEPIGDNIYISIDRILNGESVTIFEKKLEK